MWSALVTTAKNMPDGPADDLMDLAGAVFAVLDRHSTRRIGASPIFAELRQASWALQLGRY